MQPNDLQVQPIDLQALSSVRGGFGALIGAALQAAPGILQGVSGIIAAAKGRGGDGGAPAGAPAQASAGQPPAQTASAAGGSPCGAGGCCQQMASPMGPMMQMIKFG
jgi:hypothetical protein